MVLMTPQLCDWIVTLWLQNDWIVHFFEKNVFYEKFETYTKLECIMQYLWLTFNIHINILTILLCFSNIKGLLLILLGMLDMLGKIAMIDWLIYNNEEFRPRDKGT